MTLVYDMYVFTGAFVHTMNGLWPNETYYYVVCIQTATYDMRIADSEGGRYVRMYVVARTFHISSDQLCVDRGIIICGYGECC